MSPRRVATIDIGTNSVLLLAAERGADGRIESLAERIEITRLGRGVDKSGALDPGALADTLAAVASFAAEARALGCEGPFATATSAARDAANGHLLVEGAQKLGVQVEIISGLREAQLAYSAVARESAGPVAVVDIGGGSTEIILGEGGVIQWRHSFDLGSVRLTERFVEEDPPSPESIARMQAEIESLFRALPKARGGVVGIAGTFTTLAALELGMTSWDASRVHGLALKLETLEALGRRLSTMTLAERRGLAGMPEKRADVIVAGALIAAGAVRALGADSLSIGDRGVRWGLLYERLGA